jgi:hypothetical protein
VLLLCEEKKVHDCSEEHKKDITWGLAYLQTFPHAAHSFIVGVEVIMTNVQLRPRFHSKQQLNYPSIPQHDDVVVLNIPISCTDD